LRALARLLGTWFGCGCVPKAPGTVGSLGGLLAAGLLYGHPVVAPIGFAVMAALLLRPAVWAADVMARESKQDDPQTVVIDEVVGQWLTLAGATVLNWKSWLLGFVLFRLFDIWKPWPVRQLERLSGGLGIVADDVMAGVYGALVLFAAGWFNLY
jgi:phosphatidylglycerophosphatase A